MLHTEEVTSAVPDLVLVLKNMFAWIEVMRTFVPAYARTTALLQRCTDHADVHSANAM